MNRKPGLFRLLGKVQHYSWGGHHYLPALLGRSNAADEPYAEYWMGTHPRGSSILQGTDGPADLASLIAREPEAWLGASASRRFGGQLPFLFKLLDVHKMLSIQAHPNKRQAEAGFARENEAGIPLDAAHRLFRDDNHKPELMVALSDFHLLHGFKSLNAIRATLRRYPAFQSLSKLGTSVKSLYHELMSLPQGEVNVILASLQSTLQRENDTRPYTPGMPEYWALSAIRDYRSAAGDYDRGVFSIFLLHLVHLAPGQGIYQAAGIPHAYLSGVNVELMANSDNVFRGGLTPKHVDVEALMAHLDFDPVEPKIIHARKEKDQTISYPTPADDFVLRSVVLPRQATLELPARDSLQIWIIVQGAGRFTSHDMQYSRGNAFLLRPGTALGMKAYTQTVAYLAGIPEKRAS